MDAQEPAADAGAPGKKKAAAKKRWDEKEDARPSPTVAPREDGGKDAALAECAVSCCLFCACLPVSVRCWRLGRRRGRGRPARRLAPGGGSSSFSDAELGDSRQGRRRAIADEDDGRGRSTTAPPPAPPQQPPPRDRKRS